LRKADLALTLLVGNETTQTCSGSSFATRARHLTWPWATEDRIQLKEDLKTQVALWLAADQKVGVPELHRRRLLLRSGSLDNPEPTAFSVLMIHGLHDSPKAMTHLVEVVAKLSANTLVSRMRGHFETDRSVLKRTVRWEAWLADAEADLALAQKLGGKVVLLGHSTGALLLTWLAIRNPAKNCRVDFVFSSFRRSFLRSGRGLGKLFDEN
jgi:pimeloyl-ACP methyl ester carboxylesterase